MISAEFTDKKYRIIRRSLLATAIVFLVIGLDLERFGGLVPLPDRRAPDMQQVDRAIRAAGDYIVRECDPSGKFTYRVNLNPEVDVKPGYNLVRHAGTVYALNAYERRRPDPKTRNAIVRAARFFQEASLGLVPGKTEMLGVWSRPELIGDKRPVQVKLGGNALGLVALIGANRIDPGTAARDDLLKMGRFILYMQKREGNFYSNYIPMTGGRSDHFESLYYPGEAALGLVMLYETDGSPAWLEAAAKAIAFLARERQGKQEVEADHWALLATEKLLPVYSNSSQPVPRQAVIDHAVQICESILAAQPRHAENRPEHGCLTRGGRTCPTATRLEGLLAGIRFLPDEYADLKFRMLAAAHSGIRFLMRAQVAGGKYEGGIPRNVGPLPARRSSKRRSSDKQATEVRIDYVQHALSALIGYRELQYNQIANNP